MNAKGLSRRNRVILTETVAFSIDGALLLAYLLNRTGEFLASLLGGQYAVSLVNTIAWVYFVDSKGRDGERCGFVYRYPPSQKAYSCLWSESHHPRDAGHPFQPSQSVRETAEVRTNPASGDRPDTVTHTPGLGTSASKRADTLLPVSLSARETAVAVMPNPLCAGSAGCSENGATPASKRADNLLPLWCLPALVPP